MSFSSELSGGEIQLLALARALLQKSKVLILDEATSGLDQETEESLHKVLRRNFADTTTVAIMHRLKLTVSELILIL
jgi:ATP-binding cassette subfamily C (CFTR/MRP) protein 1